LFIIKFLACNIAQPWQGTAVLGTHAASMMDGLKTLKLNRHRHVWSVRLTASGIKQAAKR